MASKSSNQSRLWIGIVVVLILVAGLLYFVLPASRERITVRSARAERGDLVKQVATNGRVEPLVDFQAHALSPSTVHQLYVQLGEVVHPHQALLKLDASEAQLRLANARNLLTVNSQDLRNQRNGGTQDELLGERSDLSNAQRELQTAINNLIALKQLQAHGSASANEITAAQQRVTDDQAKITQIQTRLGGRYGEGDLANTQSQLARDRQELATAQSNLASMDLRSPIEGTVYSLPIARYDYVSPGQILISVADLHKLRVRAFFDEPVIGSLAKGQAVSIVWDAKPDRTWHGHVTQAPTTVTNIGSRNVGECLISVDDANGELLPNTNVTVSVTTLQRFGVLSLPREALHTQGTSNFVFRIIAGKLARTNVSVGVVNLTRIEVTGGLAPGDTVALGATTDVELQDGQAVRTQP